MLSMNDLPRVLGKPEATRVMAEVRGLLASAQQLLSELEPEVQRAVELVHEDNDGTDHSLMRTLRGAVAQCDDILMEGQKPKRSASPGM